VKFPPNIKFTSAENLQL